jgi:predicted component of type VI protein secretion system
MHLLTLAIVTVNPKAAAPLDPSFISPATSGFAAGTASPFVNALRTPCQIQAMPRLAGPLAASAIAESAGVATFLSCALNSRRVSHLFYFDK